MGILAEVPKTQRLAVTDQHSQNPSPTREVADRRVRLCIDPNGDELFETGTKPVDHPERPVARSRQLDRRLDQFPQQRLE